MSNLYLAVSVVFPLFCMMALGYVLRAVGIFNEPFLKQLNSLCFKIFLPFVLFINIYRSDFKSLFSGKLVLFSAACVLGAFLLLMIFIPLMEKDNKNRGVMVQGIFRSNFILFGVPIVTSLYGENHLGTTSILIAFMIPLFNVLSIIALEIFSDQEKSKTGLMAEIIKNPLILGSLAAFFFVLTGFRLPLVLENTVSDISKVATPLALIVLGGSFAFSGIGVYGKLLAFSVFGKLILMPAIFLPISLALGFGGMELAALMAMFTSPTAVSTFTMAQNASANDQLAGQIVVFDSMLSIISLFGWITLLKYLGVI